MATWMLIAAALQAAAPPPTGPLDWLAQDWICRAEMPASGPAWRVLKIAREGEGLTGSFGLERADAGRREERPEGRLHIAGETLLLTYAPEYDVATEYRLVRNEPGEAVFETRERTVPQRIAFRTSGIGITVIMSQLDGRLATSTYYSRPGLHMGAGGCNGSR